MCSTVVNVGTDQTSYTVLEGVGQLEFHVLITNGEKAPGQECEIAFVTVDLEAVGELKITINFEFFTPLRPCIFMMPCFSLQPRLTILHHQKV